MRLQELFETTEEDRALISLSSSIYAKLEDYINVDLDFDDEEQEIFFLGKIGDIFETSIPVLEDIRIELQGSGPFLRRARQSSADDVMKDPETGTMLAIWDGNTSTMVFNTDYLDHPKIKTAITHELRHALDDYKSDFAAGLSKRYATPKKKEHRKDDPYSTLKYRAQPAEINARFAELLHTLSGSIRIAYKRFAPDQIRPKIMRYFEHLLDQYGIADIFPERTQSPDYKRLVKRAIDFIQKEMKYIEAELAKSGNPKIATGNF